MTLYTVGHSNLSFGEFLSLLERHGIATVVDVRSAPYSKHAPQFNKAELEMELPEAGIRYVYEGAALGGRPREAECYRHGAVPEEGTDYLHEVDYAAVMRRPWFLQGVQRLIAEAAAAPTAVLCSEADPLQCHRHHLLARFLGEAHPEVEVRHVVQQGDFAARDLPSVADQPTSDQLSLF